MFEPSDAGAQFLLAHGLQYEIGLAGSQRDTYPLAVLGVTDDDDESLLRDAGFARVVPVALSIPFQGWLAIR